MRQELINEELRESADWLFCTLSPGMIPCGRTSLFGAFKQKKTKKKHFRVFECLSPLSKEWKWTRSWTGVTGVISHWWAPSLPPLPPLPLPLHALISSCRNTLSSSAAAAWLWHNRHVCKLTHTHTHTRTLTHTHRGTNPLVSRTTCDFFHLAEGEEKEEEEEGGGEWTATGAFLSFLEGYRDLEEDQNKVCPIGRRTEQNTTEQNRSGVCVCVWLYCGQRRDRMVWEDGALGEKMLMLPHAASGANWLLDVCSNLTERAHTVQKMLHRTSGGVLIL